MDVELIAARYRMSIHSEFKGHVICREGSGWAIIEPNGNVQFDIRSLAVAKAWINS